MNRGQNNDTGIIFDIQYGAMYDGPGLRTAVFFKGCPLRCRWCQNPESQEPKPQLSFFAERCRSCGTCAAACNAESLKMRGGLPVRDNEICRLCGQCAHACPSKAMELIGYKITATALLQKLRRDRPFYESSGGGVTITGGEPTMQPRFLLKTLSLLKEDRIATAIETCGYFKTALIDELVEVTDLFLYDIKHTNSTTHKKHTGRDNRVIKKNFRQLLAKAGPEKITPRIPLIPNFNTDKESLSAITKFIKETGYRDEIQLMPFNPLTKTKYQKINRQPEHQNLAAQTPEELETIVRRLKQNYGGEVTVIN